MTETKQCGSCGEKKPTTEFNFRKDRNCFRSRCKKCSSKAVMAARDPKTHKAKHAAYLKNSPMYGADSWMNAPEGETRLCNPKGGWGCGETKPVTPDHWQRDPHAKWGLRPSGCKECLRKRPCASCGERKPTGTMSYLKHKGAHYCPNCLDEALE
jgi:hypothetical protein